MTCARGRLLLLMVVMTGFLPGVLAIGQSQDQAADQSSPPTPQADTNPQAPVHVSSGVASGYLIRRVNPEYPKKARKQHIQGTVILTAKIDKNGDIADLTVVSGDPLLAKAAIAAVKQWKYKPYFWQGKPVEVDTTVQVNFTLSPSQTAALSRKIAVCVLVLRDFSVQP